MKLSWREKFPIISFVNGLIYGIACAIAGGSAWHGRVINDVYYVGSYGEYYRVSTEFYHYSLWHGAIVMVNIIVLIVALALVEFRRNR